MLPEPSLESSTRLGSDDRAVKAIELRFQIQTLTSRGGSRVVGVHGNHLTSIVYLHWLGGHGNRTGMTVGGGWVTDKLRGLRGSSGIDLPPVGLEDGEGGVGGSYGDSRLENNVLS